MSISETTEACDTTRVDPARPDPARPGGVDVPPFPVFDPPGVPEDV